MKKTLLYVLITVLLLSSSSLYIPYEQNSAEASKVTQYRVYQNDKPLKEFPTLSSAIQYAGYFAYSHVESISNRAWVWDNFPRYKVYSSGQSSSKMEFKTLNQAIAHAKTLTNAYVRDLQNIGWAYENFSNYKLYQGDNSKSSWEFYSLDEAKKEAKKWSNAHIIDLNSNQWIWDNLTQFQIQQQSSSSPKYQLVQDGTQIKGTKTYTFLKNAIIAANQYKNVQVINIDTGKVVHDNLLHYEVYANGKLQASYSGLDQAVAAAKSLYLSEVKKDNQLLWSSVPYLSVYQGETNLKGFHTINSALAYAKAYANSSIRNQDGRTIWSKDDDFIFMGWNGSSSATTIYNHVGNTQGLDIDSPTWYELKNENGDLNDFSNINVVKELKSKGIKVAPLIHNQFDKEMTSKFLSNSAAQNKFIQAIMQSLVNLGVSSVNLDFENLAAADRNNYTSFVQSFTTAAHAKNIEVSIDLMRGDVRWNHLTAYDQAKIGQIVDYVIIMAYDEHWSGSDVPGSVAGLDWTEKGIEQYLNYGIPRDKLILGIPFYTREWRLDSKGNLVDNRTLLMKDIPTIIASNKAVKTYDAKAGYDKYTYTKDGYTHVFWAETSDTVLQRIKLAKKYDLAGIAAWRLGYEPSNLWEQMLRIKNQ